MTGAGWGRNGLHTFIFSQSWQLATSQTRRFLGIQGVGLKNHIYALLWLAGVGMVCPVKATWPSACCIPSQAVTERNVCMEWGPARYHGIHLVFMGREKLRITQVSRLFVSHWKLLRPLRDHAFIKNPGLGLEQTLRHIPDTYAMNHRLILSSMVRNLSTPR